MLQRVQTVFLMMNDVIFVALFFIPFMSRSDAKGAEFGVNYTLTDVVPALIGELVLATLASFVIVQYRNRKFQMKLCTIGAVLAVLNTTMLVFLTMMNNISVTTGEAHYNTEIGTYLSLGHFVLFMLARIFIKRDEDLVSSVDRIR
jgi:hypothetical protein